MILALNSRLLVAHVNSSSSSSSSSSHDPTTQTQDFVVIVAALFCALICVLGLIAVVRCAWIRRIPQNSPPASATASTSSAKNKGLNKNDFNSLPKLTYSSFHDQHQHQHHHDDDDDDDEKRTGSGRQFSVDCAICLAEFVSGEEIRLLPQCRHVFHVGCIDEWLKSHSSCPSCRVQIFQQQQQSVTCVENAHRQAAPPPRGLEQP